MENYRIQNKQGEVNLSWADLSGPLLPEELSWANLRMAKLYGVTAPKIKNIHQSVFDAASAVGALDMEVWHLDGFCGTTHCRAGWVCHLAGEAGRALEDIYGTSAAAAFIYIASDPSIAKIPNWTDTAENALADMQRLAELEAA